MPSMDAAFVSFEDGDNEGTVLADTLFDTQGRVILPDLEVDQLGRWLDTIKEEGGRDAGRIDSGDEKGDD